MRALWLVLGVAACGGDEKGRDTGGEAPPLVQNDADGDGLVAAEDCDDNDPSVGGPTTWYADRDGDKHGNPDDPSEEPSCDPPEGHVATADDCDDLDADVYPGAPETCDGIDDDCDGLVDDEDDAISGGATFYADADGDGWGDDAEAVEACEQPSGTSEAGGDCDDGDPAVNPGADETCNWVDDDCDGEVDEGLPTSPWYLDADGDGWGVEDDAVEDCAAPAEDRVAEAGDCDDGDPAVNPGEDERCDGVDDDCDGDVDESDAVDATTWYADADGDGYGDPDAPVPGCEQPSGTVANDEDCDDGDAAISPEGVETCDGVDDDCDGDVDEDDALDAATWYADNDGDGWGDPDDTVVACDEPPGYGAGAGDCDDTDDDVYPGAHEVCGDGVDSDCDGADGSCGDASLGDADVKLAGLAAGDKAGGAVALGDVDGDGLADLLVGASRADGTGTTDAGAAWVVLGPASGATSLADAVASAEGAADDDHLGGTVAVAGDVDGDGLADVILGATGSDEGGAEAGAAWVFLGPWSGAGPVGGADAELTGEAAGDGAGLVAAAGDVDGDGVADLLVGAPGRDAGGADAGSAYLLLGPVSADLDLSFANAELIGEAAGDAAGSAVAGAGDTDGDGTDDLLVGAPDEATGGSGAGAAYLLQGPVRRSRYLSSADAKVVGGAADDALGSAVAGAGDVDGDGLADVILGAPGNDDGGADAGAAYLFLGPVTGSLDPGGAHAILVGESPGDAAGRAVAGAGDVNGDGFADLLVGASAEDAGGTGAGAAYVVFGPVSGTRDLFDTDAKLIGEAAGDAAGIAVAGGADADGDGLDDVLVGATGEDSGGSAAGAVYLVLGAGL